MERTNEEIITLIDETVEYYSSDTSRRAINPKWKSGSWEAVHKCLYFINGSTPKMCAVGRCLIKPKGKEKVLGRGTGVRSLFRHYKFPQNQFKPEYRGFDVDVWLGLQRFHDNDENWNDDGLTLEGKGVIKRLKAQFN